MEPPHPLLPDENGFFGKYGGQYLSEELNPNLTELTREFYNIIEDKTFWFSFVNLVQEFSGRPTPITFAGNLTRLLGGAQIYLKREDLNHTGAHKINNALGQGLLMQRLGKKRVVAETGAGQHGLATSIMAARFGFDAHIYMGSEDVRRQRPNVFWMERFGAEVNPVQKGDCTLKEAITAALEDWLVNRKTTHYLLGTVCGPHPFPALVSYLQSIIGLEARMQMLERLGRLPSKVYACVGGGSNAVGIFQGFLTGDVELIGVEAGGTGIKSGEHASRIASGQGSLGIAQGYKTIFLQNEAGKLLSTHSIAAGLDYVGISPIIADWADQGKVRIEQAFDEEVIEAAKLLMQAEGIIPALESSHALATAFKEAKNLSSDDILLISLSGRGDKDIFAYGRILGDKSWTDYLKSIIEYE
ncbi:MAG: tryptophan synthase subunit beta [Gammaproteobacteria bacterium]|nr:tryptophan synthase subunit beta [Gammaproteobacteria bacterium]